MNLKKEQVDWVIFAIVLGIKPKLADFWQNIDIKTNTQKSFVKSMTDVDNQKIAIKTFSQSSTFAKPMYKALNYKPAAF